jgi:hypothetical protein
MVTVVSGCAPHRIAIVDNRTGAAAAQRGRVFCPFCDATPTQGN